MKIDQSAALGGLRFLEISATDSFAAPLLAMLLADQGAAVAKVGHDDNGEPLEGSNGTYTLTTEEPPVDAHWSITVYDTARGGFLHPNKDDRYHLNNTTAVKNADGTVTFTFKTACDPDDLNCLEVPAGRFDVASRYYLPQQAIVDDRWQIARPKLQ